MRYTQQVGKEKMAMKVGMTYACMNMKKLANLLWGRDRNTIDSKGKPSLADYLRRFFIIISQRSPLSYA